MNVYIGLHIHIRYDYDYKLTYKHTNKHADPLTMRVHLRTGPTHYMTHRERK